MKIIRGADTWTFVPVEADEERSVAAALSFLKTEDTMSYRGIVGSHKISDRFCTIAFGVGGKLEKNTENVGVGGSSDYFVYVGGVKLILHGSTEEDKLAINGIRNICFFGVGGIVFLGETKIDGKRSIIATGRRCVTCGAGMVRRSECEWGFCAKCSEKCEHNYVHGLIHGGKNELGAGEFCNKCGRLNPKDKRAEKESN